MNIALFELSILHYGKNNINAIISHIAVRPYIIYICFEYLVGPAYTHIYVNYW